MSPLRPMKSIRFGPENEPTLEDLFEVWMWFSATRDLSPSIVREVDLALVHLLRHVTAPGV